MQHITLLFNLLDAFLKTCEKTCNLFKVTTEITARYPKILNLTARDVRSLTTDHKVLREGKLGSRSACSPEEGSGRRPVPVPVLDKPTPTTPTELHMNTPATSPRCCEKKGKMHREPTRSTEKLGHHGPKCPENRSSDIKYKQACACERTSANTHTRCFSAKTKKKMIFSNAHILDLLTRLDLLYHGTLSLGAPPTRVSLGCHPAVHLCPGANLASVVVLTQKQLWARP